MRARARGASAVTSFRALSIHNVQLVTRYSTLYLNLPLIPPTTGTVHIDDSFGHD